MAGVGKRTLTEFEAGERAVYPATENKIKAFYLSQGLTFSSPKEGEGVKFAAADDVGATAAAVREKKETLDLLGAREISDEISHALGIHEKIRDKISISQIIIGEALKISGLNQKDMAANLDCTPSFVNSIAVGKKSIPIKYAGAIQKYFDLRMLDVAKALELEKRSGKITGQIIALHQQYLDAWKSASS